MSTVDFLPEHWAKSPSISAHQEGIEAQLIGLHSATEETLNQLNIQTATWALDDWERAYGLAIDRAKPLSYRRSRLISKLRGQGTATVALIKTVAESFSNGAVEIIEHPEGYHFDIKFVGTVGIPPNMADLTAAIEEMKPAHLGYEYIIIFRTWGEVGAKTWGALGGKTWGAVKEGQI